MVIIENRKRNLNSYVSTLSNEELDNLINIAYEEKKKRSIEKYKSRQSLYYKKETVKEEVKVDPQTDAYKATSDKAKNVMKKIIEIRRYFKCSDKLLFKDCCSPSNYFYKSKTDKNLLAYIYNGLTTLTYIILNIQYDPDFSEEVKDSYTDILLTTNDFLDDFDAYLDIVKENAKTHGNTKLDKDIIKQLDGYNSILEMTNSGIQILDKGYDMQAIKGCKKAYRKLQKYFNK